MEDLNQVVEIALEARRETAQDALMEERIDEALGRSVSPLEDEEVKLPDTEDESPVVEIALEARRETAKDALVEDADEALGEQSVEVDEILPEFSQEAESHHPAEDKAKQFEETAGHEESVALNSVELMVEDHKEETDSLQQGNQMPSTRTLKVKQIKSFFKVDNRMDYKNRIYRTKIKMHKWISDYYNVN